MIDRVRLFSAILFFILCVPFAQLSVWAQTRTTNDQEMPTVKVAISDDQSIIIERILYEGLKRSGYQMVAQTTGMRTAVADVNYGDAAILPVQTDGWERIYPNLRKVPVIIDNVEFSTYTLQDKSYQFFRWSDMVGLRIGYRWQNESIANNIWRAQARELVRLNNIEELWASLHNNETDAIILPRMSHFEHRYSEGIKTAGIIERQPVYTYVNSGHSYLVPLLEKAYLEMHADGTITRIHNNYHSNEKPIILHINSYNAQNEWERSQMESIRRNIELELSNGSTKRGIQETSLFEYYNYYLNSNELHSRASFNAIVSNMIRTGFVMRQPDLIIASGNEAIEFVLENYYFLFPNIPVVFFGVQGLQKSILRELENNITGVTQAISFEETVSEMLKLFPMTRRIFILNDHTIIKSKIMFDEIQECIASGFSPVEFIFSENKPFAEILNDISGFGSDTLVLIGYYLSDSNSTFYSEVDVQNLVTEASVNPVFFLTTSYSGHGTLGGLVTNAEERSATVASMASDIIKGIPPSRIPIIFDSAALNQWHFDYKTAKKFNINVRNFPAEHIIINRSPPIWESNPLEFQLIIAVAFLFILLSFGTIAFLRVLSRKQADENMHLLLESLPMSCNLWGPNFNLIDCNKAGIELYGFTDKQDYLERFLPNCSPEYQPDGQRSDKSAKMHVTKAFDEGYCKVEWMHLHLNGDLIPTEVTLIRVKHHKEGYLVAGYTRDLREYKKYIAEIEKAQEELRHARDAAEAASRIKTTFLANMSHEIRTPMNSIIGFAELAQYNDSPHKTKEYVKNISQNAQWLLKIINDILDISKIESGKILLEHISFDLHDILAQCQMTIIPKTEEKGIALYCYAEPSINKKLKGDPIRLRQVLTNLLSNAVKFTQSGTIKLMASLLNSNEKNITIHFEVKDSGIGMDSVQVTRIFEPFTQADDSVTRRFGGTGLGLSITKNIIELMGGTLAVESAAGIGSKFCFEITFDFADENTDTSPKENFLQTSERPVFKGEALICEDNNMNQQVIKEHLARVGIKSIIASNGKEGVDLAEERVRSGKKQFDLILMDIHMPVMDGLEAASKIIGIGIKTPIVALTANIMSHDLEIYKKNGIIDCLGKPFTSQELCKCLIKYLPVISYSSEDQGLNREREEQFQKQMRLNFVRNNQNTYANIVKAVNENDFKLAHRIAHTLKSNAGQIGKTKLQATSAALEAMLSEGKNPLNTNEIETLKTELNIILEELAPLLAENEEKKKIKIDDIRQIREILAKLEPLLINKNPECEELLGELFKIPGAENLAHLVDIFNFKEAIVELAKLKTKMGVE